MDVPAPDPQQIIGLSRWNVNDFQCVPNPGNPSTGLIRLYCDSSTGNLTCLTSTGASCSSSGGGAGATTATNLDIGVIKASGFGVTNAGSRACDATFTNASGTVTLGATDVTPTASMIGWSMQGSGSCIDGSSYTSVMPRCVITSVNSGTRTLTGSGCSANANATGTATQQVVFAPIEDTQLTAAANAAFNANSGQCPTLQLPSGFTYLTQPNLNTYLCNTQMTGSASTGAHIQGWGRMGSLLGLSSDFNYAAAPLFSGVKTVFFGANGVTKMNMGVTGFQHPGTNPAASTTIINDSTDDFTLNFSITGVGSALTNLTAFSMTGFGTTDWLVIVDGAGGTALSTAGGECSQCVFLNSINGSSVSGPWSTKQGGYGQGGTSASLVSVGAGAQFSTDNDVYLWNPGVGQFAVDCSGNCYVTGMHFGSVVPHVNDQPIRVNAGGQVIAVANKYTPGASVWSIAMNGGVYHDGCGNVYQSVKVNNLAGSGGTGTFVPCDDGSSTYGVAPVANMLNCASAASPAVCGGFTSGSAVIAAGATTVVVNTTAITANDEIFIDQDQGLGTKLGVTCNTQSALILGDPKNTARAAGTSFTVGIDAAPTANPLCFNWTIKK